MGLDMYLNASRSFEPDSEQAEAVLAAAGVTLDQLHALAVLDPNEDETSVYLPRWEFYESERKVQAETVEAAAGLLAFATPESGGGTLAWRDGKVWVDITCMYWRKANAIHAWFVDECQDGVDECQHSPVHPEQLAKLRATCADALAAYETGDLDKAEEIMKPRSGFFFGSTDVDQWWVEDLRYTIADIDRVVRLVIDNRTPVEFEYHSSW